MSLSGCRMRLKSEQHEFDAKRKCLRADGSRIQQANTPSTRKKKHNVARARQSDRDMSCPTNAGTVCHTAFVLRKSA